MLQFFDRRRIDRFLDLRNQLRLLQGLSTDDELAGKCSAFLHIDRTSDHVAIEGTGAANCDDRIGDDLTRHLPADLDRADMKLPEELNIALPADHDFGCGQFSMHLNCSTEFSFLCAMQTAT